MYADHFEYLTLRDQRGGHPLLLNHQIFANKTGHPREGSERNAEPIACRGGLEIQHSDMFWDQL